MTAYEMSEKKIKLLSKINILTNYLDNNTKTVLLTNNEVEEIVDVLNDCILLLDENLKSKG